MCQGGGVPFDPIALQPAPAMMQPTPGMMHLGWSAPTHPAYPPQSHLPMGTLLPGQFPHHMMNPMNQGSYTQKTAILNDSDLAQLGFWGNMMQHPVKFSMGSVGRKLDSPSAPSYGPYAYPKPTHAECA